MQEIVFVVVVVQLGPSGSGLRLMLQRVACNVGHTVPAMPAVLPNHPD